MNELEKKVTTVFKDDNGDIHASYRHIPKNKSTNELIEDPNTLYVKVEYGEEIDLDITSDVDSIIESSITLETEEEDVDGLLKNMYGMTMEEAKLSQMDQREGILPPTPKDQRTNKRLIGGARYDGDELLDEDRGEKVGTLDSTVAKEEPMYMLVNEELIEVPRGYELPRSLTNE